MKILVTGGAGFIGSAVVRHLIGHTGHSVINVDKLTYAANLASLRSVANSGRYAFEQADIVDTDALRDIFERYEPTAVMHLAAETHVDRSIDGADVFIRTNVLGTHRLLDVALEYWRKLSPRDRGAFRFHHISTDEVFGSLEHDEPAFHEETPYAPRSPYAASKACSDHLVRAWNHTYGLPVLITNCTNNYGPYQFPEKLIPLAILKCIEGLPVPVYGDGQNVRDWLYVDDHARALSCVLERGSIGETYGIGGSSERTNLSVVQTICDMVDELAGSLSGRAARRDLIEFVADRPGHDFRYAMNTRKINEKIAWEPTESFETGIRRTVGWFMENRSWWAPLRARYEGQRLGMRKPRARGVTDFRP